MSQPDPEIQSPYATMPSKVRRVFPPPFTPQTRQRVLAALARGESITTAAKSAGTSSEPVVVVIRELAAAELGDVIIPDEPEPAAGIEPTEIERRLTAAANTFLRGDP